MRVRTTAGMAWLLCAGVLACSWRASPEPHAPGGPFYFERIDQPVLFSVYSTLPRGEISRAEARARSIWIEAWFDERGRLERMVKCPDHRVQFDRRYHYDDAGSFQREESVALPEVAPDGRLPAGACS